MKKEKIFLGVMSFALVIALYCVPAAAQKFTGGVKGKVTQNSEPMPNLQLVFTDTDMGRQYKAKTDKNGEFYSDGMRLANYKLQIIGPNKEVLYTNDHVVIGSNSLADFPIELAKPEASGGVAGSSGVPTQAASCADGLAPGCTAPMGPAPSRTASPRSDRPTAPRPAVASRSSAARWP